MTLESEVGRVKITVEMEGKDTIEYEFPRVKELKLESQPRYARSDGWPLAKEELICAYFGVTLHVLLKDGLSYTCKVVTDANPSS